jgi:hypothetical protein
MHNYKRLDEAFESRRWQKGEVKFSETKITDPHIQKILKETARITNVPIAEVEQDLQKKIDSFKDIAAKAPILYGTILKNIVEDQAFNLLMDHKISSPSCPRFNKAIFYQLEEQIKSDHEQFYPLRSFLNFKRIYDTTPLFTNNPDYPQFKDVTTACATPDGKFVFNPDFCQHLMDMAHLKQVKPKGLKYESNGGDIPDEYCYIEFVIIHEFMHYTYDDFHYQKIIQNSDPQIINWVGDFRTNYLLVKSGYEQLPMGLFNDDINYDRQDTYIQMYNLVKSEMENLNDGQQKRVQEALDGMSDDHEPGQQQGKQMDQGKDGEATEADIDEQNRKIEEQMKEGKDKSSKEANEEARKREAERAAAEAAAKKAEQERKSSQPGHGANGDKGVDYSNVKPHFKWQELIRKFVSSAHVESETTYAKQSRSGISGIITAAQTGKGPISPGEVEFPLSKVNLCFCIDNSGSMDTAVGKVYANIVNLLKQHSNLQDAEMLLLKFSSGHDMYKVVFRGDKAAKIQHLDDKPKTWDLKFSNIFKHTLAGGTEFDRHLATDLLYLLHEGYNVLIFSDQDITHGDFHKEKIQADKTKNTKPALLKTKEEQEAAKKQSLSNFSELARILSGHSSYSGKVFLIFDTKYNYGKFLEKGNFGSLYVSHLDY